VAWLEDGKERPTSN